MKSENVYETAINILINAARKGQSRGAYTLEEAEVISKSVKIFTNEPIAITSAQEQQVSSPDLSQDI
jgi:hypothetical protein